MKKTPFAKTTLIKELALLQQENKLVAASIKVSNEKERTHMVISYLWWRKAVKVAGLLKELYEANNIPNRAVKSKINFRPLLRLLSNGEISNTDLDLWNVCLNKLHVEFENSAKHYATDTVARLSHFIDNKGGKTGLAGYHLKDKAEYEEDDGSSEDNQKVKEWDALLDEQEYIPTFAEEAKLHYGGKELLKADLPAIPLTNEGYGVVIVKKDGTKSSLMNVLSDERVVNNLIVDTYRKDMDAMPATLRSILEPLHLLNVPKTMAENIDLFIENSKVDSAWFDNKKVPALKRMTYRQANGDFLVSNICANSGVVVVAKPIQKNLFHKPVADLCLTTMHRLGIEVRLLHKQMFNMYATNCEKQFEIVKTSIFTYQLPLQNKMHIEAMEGLESDEIAKNIKDFHFKPIGWMPFYTNAPTYYPQVAIQKHGIKQSWSCDADLEWMREATDQFFDCWIAAYAKKHKRKINKTMQITLNKKGMTIGYELDDEQYDNEMLLSMTGATGKAKLVVRSTDFAFVMRQLADLNVRGAISMTANAHGIELTFATATHSYTCVIPSCDEKGERSPELFTEYMPIQMKEQFEYDFEKLDGGFTEADVLKVAAEVLA